MQRPADDIPEPPGDRVLRLIHWTSAAGRSLRRQLAATAAELELSDHELLVVWLCSSAPRIQVELATAVGVSPAQMSGMVERLRQRGLVEVHRQPLDRRRQFWRTSEAGGELLKAAVSLWEQLEASLGERLSADEQAAVLHLCRALADAPHSEQVDRQHASKEAA